MCTHVGNSVVVSMAMAVMGDMCTMLVIVIIYCYHGDGMAIRTITIW